MRLFNTLTRTIEEFTPLQAPAVTFYACGPTVYDYAHIGHARKFINDDLLKRVLTAKGYNVHHVMNITDVGHLVNDIDEGEDKMEKGAVKFGKTVYDIAEFFTDDFLAMIDAMNIIHPKEMPRATDHIPDMIELVQKLLDNDHAYITEEAIYFDVTTFPTYGKLGGQSLADKKTAVREEVVTGTQKKNPADFSLWFFRVGRFADHAMHWESPWGDGFPGWHIECSAMSMKYLGETIDLHSGGLDHIAIHHANEIAQSEAATGKRFVNYWFHTYFLTVDGVKMSKSLNNFLRPQDIIDKGYSPLALRYLYLQTHYRSEMNFTWEGLAAADAAYKKLKKTVQQLKSETERQSLSEEKLEKIDEYTRRYDDAIGNDLQIPQALAVVWEVVKSNIPSSDKLDFLLEADKVLGLDLDKAEEANEIPAEIRNLAQKRQQARADKDFTASDTLRKQIEEMGYMIKDNGDEYEIEKK